MVERSGVSATPCITRLWEKACQVPRFSGRNGIGEYGRMGESEDEAWHYLGRSLAPLGLAIYIMRIVSIILATLMIFSACSKPKEKKIAVQQVIETPVMQMAEQADVKSQAPGAATDENKQTAPTQSTPATPIVAAQVRAVKPNANIEIIIDASGSMNAPIGQTTKIDAIKTALKNILSTPLPPETNRKITLRTFGTKSPANKNDCSDTTLELKMDKHDTATVTDALDKMPPQGVSPLAFALESAYNDFTESAEKADNMVLLITDGLDSCSGDALAAAARLSKGPSQIIVDVIGFDIDQTAQDYLKRLAEAASGSFSLARTDGELFAALDQALSANLPYNLRLKVASGTTPLPSTITIYRTGTQSIVDRVETSGLKFFKLTPGTYDVMVEYKSSIEAKKPSKMIKGVEVTASSKAEQVVEFELGNLNLTAHDQNGQSATANYYIRPAGSNDIIARLTNVPSPQMVHISPGKYDIDAETADPNLPTLNAQAKEVEVKAGETAEQTLKFQTGKLFLKAQNVSKQPILASYRVTKPGATDILISGASPLEGAMIDLPPGNYDVYVTWSDPALQGAAEAKLSNLTLTGGETLEQLAIIVTGTLKLSGKDMANKYIHTEFSIKKTGTAEDMAKAVSETAPIDVVIAPGTYDIVATNTTSKVIPPPSVVWNDVTVKEGGAEAFEAVFKLGTLKLIGKNAKGQIIPATFTIYRSGTDEPLVVENSARDWITFNLTPSLYDIKAEDSDAKSEPKPSIWFHDTQIEAGKTLTSEAIFTSGKLKLLCRGKNNVLLKCEFNVFSYGSDTALFSGATAEEWREFDIPPGKYYMEAGWHDPIEEQFLKKWINISIDENQIVEEILRF